MRKAILSFITTIIVGILFTLIGEFNNFIELGPIGAIAIMGAFIIYFNEINSKS